ncbi:MAG: hypothetical protein KI786_19015, partial [Mameliella sp.]|nr:hypothetical protein [Phaeodactylibacter sp.]
KNILEIILRDSDLSQHKAIESSQIFEKFKYLDSLGYSLIDGVKDGPKTLEIIGGRMRELGYLDENNNATKNFSNRFLGTLKKIFDSPTFYKWHEEINTIPERLYIISNHYGKNCNLDKGGNVNGSYKEEISKKNKEDLIEIFEGILDISQVLKSPGKSSR